MATNDVYLGNPNLKKANTPIEFTEEQVLEFLKCVVFLGEDHSIRYLKQLLSEDLSAIFTPT